MLADEIEQVFARSLDKSRTQEHVVMNVIDANGQRPHGDRGVIALEFGPGRFCRAGYEDAVDHVRAGKGYF